MDMSESKLCKRTVTTCLFTILFLERSAKSKGKWIWTPNFEGVFTRNNTALYKQHFTNSTLLYIITLQVLTLMLGCFLSVASKMTYPILVSIAQFTSTQRSKNRELSAFRMSNFSFINLSFLSLVISVVQEDITDNHNKNSPFVISQAHMCQRIL